MATAASNSGMPGLATVKKTFAALLPRNGSYRAADRVGQHVSAKRSQYAKLISRSATTGALT